MSLLPIYCFMYSANGHHVVVIALSIAVAGKETTELDRCGEIAW